ncbi:MAG: hypothetical protein R6X10_11360 [Desulfobacterales bacterium]
MKTMRWCVIILATGFILIPCAGETAMKEMTNDSLGQVESSSGITSYPKTYPINDTLDVSPQKIEFSRFETEISSLKQNRTYMKFLLLLEELEKISKKKDYENILNSKYFLELSSNMANLSQHCGEKLTTLETTVDDHQMKELMKTQRIVFAKVNTFYDCLSDYQGGKDVLADLKKLIAEIRFGQNFFETEYSKLRSSK